MKPRLHEADFPCVSQGEGPAPQRGAAFIAGHGREQAAGHSPSPQPH